MQQVQRGVDKSQAVTGSIAHIERNAQAVEQALVSIASATSEQSLASQEIARNIARMHEMTEGADAAIQETRSETARLHQLAQDVRVRMDQFKV